MMRVGCRDYAHRPVPTASQCSTGRRAHVDNGPAARYLFLRRLFATVVTTDDVHMADRAAKPSLSDGFSDLLQTPYSDAFAFSEEEQRALDLYDKLRELELEKSLIDAVDYSMSPWLVEVSDPCPSNNAICSEQA